MNTRLKVVFYRALDSPLDSWADFREVFIARALVLGFIVSVWIAAVALLIIALYGLEH